MDLLPLLVLPYTWNYQKVGLLLEGGDVMVRENMPLFFFC